MKLSITLSILILLFIIGFFILYNNLNNNLETIKNNLVLTQTELNLNKDTLASTKNELDAVKNAFNATKNDFDAARQELASTKANLQNSNKELNSTKDSLKTTTQNLESIRSMWDSTQLELKSSQSELKKLRETVGLYEQMYGKVYSSSQLPDIVAPGSLIKLVNKTGVADPSWEQLQNFLREDLTDEKYYDVNLYNCMDFAVELHNNAETKGINTAFVTVDFKDEPVGHALNAFKTTDNGLVFVDVTGAPKDAKRPKSMDTTAIVKIGENYLRELIFERGYRVVGNYQIIWYFNKDSIVTNIKVYW